MQNRTFSENCLRTLIDSCCALSLSSTALSRTGTAVQRLDYPVGLSPSSVQPEIREGQVLSAGSHVSKGGEQRVSQGGKQESLSITAPVAMVTAGYNEAVAEPVHFEAPVKPERKSAGIYKWVDNNGTVHFSDQRRGELVHLGNSVSYVNTDALRSATRERQNAKQLRAAEEHRTSAAAEPRRKVNLLFADSI